MPDRTKVLQSRTPAQRGANGRTCGLALAGVVLVGRSQSSRAYLVAARFIPPRTSMPSSPPSRTSVQARCWASRCRLSACTPSGSSPWQRRLSCRRCSPGNVLPGRRFPTGAAFFAAARRMAGIVDRILKGARPGDVPVEVVTQHKLSINLRVARELTVQRERRARQTCAAQAILARCVVSHSQSMKREGFWHLGPVDELSADSLSLRVALACRNCCSEFASSPGTSASENPALSTRT